MKMNKLAVVGIFGLTMMWGAAAVQASPVIFDAATETFAQTIASSSGPWSAALAIDGSTDGNYDGRANGWAIDDPNPNVVDQTPTPQSAFFRFASPLVLAPTESLQINLFQLFNYDGTLLTYHTLGAFNLAVTGDSLAGEFDSSTELAISAKNWITLVPPSITVSSTPPLLGVPKYSISTGGDILVNNPGLPTAVYTITAKPGISTITGIRLTILGDSSLPFNGPGFQPTNGNFVLNEITAAAVPLPASVGVGFSMLSGFGCLFAVRKRLRRSQRIAV